MAPGGATREAPGGIARPPGATSDPDCTGSYGGAPPKAGAPLRFGIDPGIAGSAGGVQLPSTPDDPAKDLAAVQTLGPQGKLLVVRLNRPRLAMTNPDRK